MTYQIGPKDVQKAIWNMKSNIALIVLSENPRISFHVQFLCREDGTPYCTSGYQIENTNVCYETTPVKEVIKIFNEELLKWDSNKE